MTPCQAQQPQLNVYAILADGMRIEARNLRFIEKDKFEIQTLTGPKSLSASDLVMWGAFLEIRRGCGVAVASQRDPVSSPFNQVSMLAGEVSSIDDQEIQLSTSVFGKVVLKRTNVLGMIWRRPADSQQRDQLSKRLTHERRSRDVLWMTNGDELTGEIAPSAAANQGLHEILVASKADSSPVKSAVENVIAVGLANDGSADHAAVKPYAVVGLVDGSLLWISAISPADSQVELTLLDGQKLLADSETFWSNITGWQMFGGKVAYLSDFPTVGYKHIPFLSVTWPYGVDRNDRHGSMRCGSTVFPKGIGMHSTSRLAYDLGKRYRRFDAEIALDDMAGSDGSVVFRVFVEKKAGDEPATGDVNRNAKSASATQWEVAYTSPVVRGGDAPLPISVDISQSTRIALVIDFADRGDEHDHANWLNARVSH